MVSFALQMAEETNGALEPTSISGVVCLGVYHRRTPCCRPKQKLRNS
ncbi:MAG: hypothetical protein ACLR23_05980 [Clostridia bacterium]